MNQEYYKKIQQEYIYFIFGILSVELLTQISLFLNLKFNTLMNPDIYIIIIPITYSIISQIFFKNLLSDTIVPQKYFEKGITFHIIISYFFNIFVYVITHKNVTDNEITFLFVLYGGPLLVYFFISWIFYYIESIRFKYYQLHYKNVILDFNIDNNDKGNESYNIEKKDVLDTCENLMKNISKKIEDNIKK